MEAARLQPHHRPARLLLELVVLVEPRLGPLVEGDQVGDVERLGAAQGARRLLREQRDQHAELRAPVPHVVEARDGVAPQLEHARQCVSDDGGAEVPHVHLLGDVGRGVVHDHALRGGGPRRAARLRAGEHRPQLCEEKGRGEAQVEEAGAGDLGRVEARVQRGGLHNLRRDVPRLRLQPLRQRHRHVALVVAELGLGRGSDERVGAHELGAVRLHQRRLHPSLQPLRHAHHLPRLRLGGSDALL